MTTTTTDPIATLPLVPWLPPVLKRSWRAPGVLQIGLDPDRAVVLRNVTTRIASFIAELDGTRRLDDVLDQSPLEADLARDIIATLARSGVLLDLSDGVDATAPTRAHPALTGALAAEIHGRALGAMPMSPGRLLHAREQAHIVVVGGGRLATALAALLAASGVGRLGIIAAGRVTNADLIPCGAGIADLGRGRLETLSDVIARSNPHSVVSAPGASDNPDLVVLAEPPDPYGDRVAMMMHTAQPFLVCTVRERRGIVGPFVIPGESSCLQCQESTRRTLDPQWAAVHAQLLGCRPALGEGGETSIVMLTASLANAQILQWLDRERLPETINATLEIALPQLILERRYWPRQEACSCLVR